MSSIDLKQEDQLEDVPMKDEELNVQQHHRAASGTSGQNKKRKKEDMTKKEPSNLSDELDE